MLMIRYHFPIIRCAILTLPPRRFALRYVYYAMITYAFIRGYACYLRPLRAATMPLPPLMTMPPSSTPSFTADADLIRCLLRYAEAIRC